jgi:MFS family permease
MFGFFRSDNTLRKKTHSIYMAAFFMSFYGGIYIVTLPFIITTVGGTDKDLGLCASMGIIAYLFGCITTGALLDRFDSRRLAQVGSGVITISTTVLLTIVLLHTHGYNLPHPVMLVMVAAMISGLLTSVYWPPIMGWLSTGREGKDLNRTLGIYNMSWSAGLAISPFVGGMLVESSIVKALFAGIAFVFLAFLAVTFAHPPKIQAANNNHSQIDPVNFQLEQFRWISRIALFAVYTCVGLMKTQLAMLFTMELHLSKSQFGTLTAIMWLVTCLLFFTATKIHSWHYKIVLTILAQVFVLISMLMIVEYSFAGAFFIVAVLMGLGQGFIYISHQFYAASQSKKRSGSMAVHEILLSAGQIVGFIAGGYLATYYGRRIAPYWFGLFVVLISIVAQIVIWRIFLNRQKKTFQVLPQAPQIMFD